MVVVLHAEVDAGGSKRSLEDNSVPQRGVGHQAETGSRPELNCIWIRNRQLHKNAVETNLNQQVKRKEQSWAWEVHNGRKSKRLIKY